MVILGTFLFNLLCSIVPCDPDFGDPELVDVSSRGARRASDVPVDELPVVRTSLGLIEGYFSRSIEGRLINTFEGIPYAEPPINEFRFRPPAPKKPWDSVLMTKKPGPFCLQIHAAKLFRVIGQEDCLYLNIYAPNIQKIMPSARSEGEPGNNESKSSQSNQRKGFPVIIWIHGGAFIFGSGGEYGAAMMLDSDVILVTINYRLGVLGFLSTGDEESPGNYGLHDQSLAIEWVHKNIHNFGGNPKKIMLMGHSAGAVAVHLHMMSSQRSRNYFHSAVSLSGNAFDHWALKTPEEGHQLAIKMGKVFGCPHKESNELVHCLRQINPVYLVAKQLNLIDWFPFPVILFSPVIEKEWSGAFITKNPKEAYESHKVARIPWITSVVAQEGYTVLLFTEPLMRTQTIKSKWRKLAPLVLGYDRALNRTYSEKVTEEITKFYFQDKDPSSASLTELSEIFSDRYFNYGFHLGLERHAQLAPAYGYIFTYKGKYGLEGALGVDRSEWGVGHAEDVFYYFNSSVTFPGFKLTDPERSMSKIMINLIVNFANSGIPYFTNRGRTEKVWTSVEPKNLQNLNILELNNDVRMIKEPFSTRIKFWEDLSLG